ncbi:type I pullulanase [Halalkalibacter alkalisediminis]|uniref:Type I pullulanase n=1 Tax=Halalkalibacter alkalisediminis TaxID=935616 RepID=A0ABV6NNK2_9BACI|nr:type I pullulanase [Halalkalibacter alkalisediminis]
MKQKKQSFVNCRLKAAELVTVDTVRVTVENAPQIDSHSWSMINSKGESPLKNVTINDEMVLIRLPKPFTFGEDSYIVYKGCSCYIKPTVVVRTKEFDQLFYYEGDDLGACYKKEETSLAVWAPTATRMNVICYKSWHDEKGETHPCWRDEKGVWRIRLQGDYEGVWYLFEVYVNQTWRCVVDPYAKFLCVNGEKAMIGDRNKTEPGKWPILETQESANDCIIYELHIRDFTISPDNGIKHKGNYLGLTEQGTTDKELRVTGLDYLSYIGITHVELLPVQEYGSVDESNRESEYNWGYDTTHFFVPEGSYASDPYDGYCRNRELKQLIATLHGRQIRVIMDVVFNHLYIWEESALDMLVPGYFFRYATENQLSDGTGVGNDFASERKMAQKIIVDAIRYWIEEYQVDGFRFDLMGILDIATMKRVREAAQKINKNILLFGEGWDLPTAYPREKRAIIDQATNLRGIGFFQDKFRDAVKGSTFEVTQPGFISGSTHGLNETLLGIQGSMDKFDKPIQAINYVESHDNHTLWDKLKLIHPIERQSILQKRHKLATAIILLSQGVPFIHAGQEWFRTKHGVENSYNSPDWVNVYNWKQRAYFDSSVEYIRTLIKIRRKHPGFRLESFKMIRNHFHVIKAESTCIAYHLRGLENVDEWKEIVVVHNAGLHEEIIFLPNEKKWQVFVDDNSASLIPLYKIGEDCAHVSPLSTFICVSL